MADWGMKISKPGIDVGTATDANDLIFTSSLDTIKVSATGLASGAGTVTIAHNLSYTPIFFVGNSFFPGLASSSVYVNGTNLVFDQPGTSPGVRYYIFYKQY